MGTNVGSGMFAGHARKRVSPASITEHLRTVTQAEVAGRQSSVFSEGSNSSKSGVNWGVKWDLAGYIRAHKAVKASGKFNFQS